MVWFTLGDRHDMEHVGNLACRTVALATWDSPDSDHSLVSLLAGLLLEADDYPHSNHLPLQSQGSELQARQTLVSKPSLLQSLVGLIHGCITVVVSGRGRCHTTVSPLF